MIDIKAVRNGFVCTKLPMLGLVRSENGSPDTCTSIMNFTPLEVILSNKDCNFPI